MLMTMTMMMVTMAKRTTKRTTMIARLTMMTAVMEMMNLSAATRESCVCIIAESSLRG